MPNLKEHLAPFLITMLSVLSVASPVTAHGPNHSEPVTVTNKTTNPVPVSVQGTVSGNVAVSNTPTVLIGGQPINVNVVGGGGTGGGGGAAPEMGAQFLKHNFGGQTVMFTSRELFGDRTDKRLVVDFLTIQAGVQENFPSGDCSLVQVRVDGDGGMALEVVRSVVTLHGNANSLWAASQQVKMFVDPGYRILAAPFPGCLATDVLVGVVGHYVDRP